MVSYYFVPWLHGLNTNIWYSRRFMPLVVHVMLFLYILHWEINLSYCTNLLLDVILTVYWCDDPMCSFAERNLWVQEYSLDPTTLILRLFWSCKLVIIWQLFQLEIQIATHFSSLLTLQIVRINVFFLWIPIFSWEMEYFDHDHVSLDSCICLSLWIIGSCFSIVSNSVLNCITLIIVNLFVFITFA